MVNKGNVQLYLIIVNYYQSWVTVVKDGLPCPTWSMRHTYLLMSSTNITTKEHNILAYGNQGEFHNMIETF